LGHRPSEEGGVLFENDISAEKTAKSEGSRLQGEDEDRWRQKGVGCQKGKGKEGLSIESLKKNQEFRVIYKNGRSLANKYLVMYVKMNGSEKNLLGISVSKKVGNSVVRHRITRLVRESVRLQEMKFNKGFSIVVVARADAKGVSYQVIEKSILDLAKRHKLLNSLS
jgi:ribonuclease P protein component